MIEVWQAMDAAPDLDVFARDIQQILGLPWVNTVAADRQGRALYMGVTVVPAVSAEQQARCVAEPYPPLVASGVMVLDGSDPSCEWGNTAGTRQPGIAHGRTSCRGRGLK